MRHKVGDKVKIKSIDWYNKNKDNDGFIECDKNYLFIEDMSEYCGQIATITAIINKGYRLDIDDRFWSWTDDMFEEENKWVTEYILPDGYQFRDENGNIINTTKIVLEKKKKEYPNTYEECCKVLGLNDLINMHLSFMDEDTKIIASTNYHTKTLIELNCLTKLRICRDAYWKIAGEEVGLGKAWEPYLESGGWYVIVNHKGKIIPQIQWCANAILAFPTEEMRDAFKKNFDKDLETCKELL